MPPHNFGQIQTESTSSPERKRKSSELSPRSAKTISTSNAEMIQFLREGPPIYPGKPPRGEVSRMRRDQDEFLDMDDDDLGGDDDAEDTNPPVRWEGPKKPKTRTAVEDFPLPPSNAPGHGLSQAQAQALLANKEQMANDLIKGYPTIQLSSETHSSPYIPPDQSPAASSPLRTLPASFRALPLLASDLPFTRIKVSHSSIKPNDKGREVLSFIVEVEPGHGKEGWKVEKLYSDVLGLDARVRASVGKGVGKKIASLPEGRLWRDHAPAKVDQRKVRLQTVHNLINWDSSLIDCGDRQL
jgi:RalA-binding protein 1